MKRSTSIIITNLFIFLAVQVLIIGYVVTMPSGIGSGFGYNKSLDVVIFLEPLFLLSYCIFVMWRLQTKSNINDGNNFSILTVSIFPVYLLTIFIASMFNWYSIVIAFFGLILLTTLSIFIINRRFKR